MEWWLSGARGKRYGKLFGAYQVSDLQDEEVPEMSFITTL